MTRVSIRQVNPAGPVLTLDLIGKVDLTGGVGGWDEINRPRRPAAVEWSGSPVRTQVLPLLVDGMEVAPGVDVSVEPAIAQLYAWGVAGPYDEPPLLALAGPLPATGGRWVIQDLALGDQQVRDGTGSRVQQAITVTLLEYLAPTIVTSVAKKARAKKKLKDYDPKKPGIQNKKGVTVDKNGKPVKK